MYTYIHMYKHMYTHTHICVLWDKLRSRFYWAYLVNKGPLDAYLQVDTVHPWKEMGVQSFKHSHP